MCCCCCWCRSWCQQAYSFRGFACPLATFHSQFATSPCDNGNRVIYHTARKQADDWFLVKRISRKRTTSTMSTISSKQNLFNSSISAIADGIWRSTRRSKFHLEPHIERGAGQSQSVAAMVQLLHIMTVSLPSQLPPSIAKRIEEGSEWRMSKIWFVRPKERDTTWLFSKGAEHLWTVLGKFLSRTAENEQTDSEENDDVSGVRGSHFSSSWSHTS
jgi:hypothetical protein